MSVLGYTVLSDDFNRADSGTVGNGWTEAETCAIVSNKLRVGDAASNAVAGVSRNLTTIGVVPYQMSGTININSGTRKWYISPYFLNASLSGLYVRFSTGGTTLDIYDGAVGGGGTTLATASPTINAATTYWFWIDITANGSNYDCNVYLNSTSTKPGSPTVTATNFTPSQTDGYTNITVDANSNTYADFDFVTYLNSDPSDISDTNVTTDTQSYGVGSESMDTNVSTDTSLVKYAYTNQSKNVSTWVNQSKS